MALGLGAGCALAQGAGGAAAGPAAEVQRSYAGLKANILKAAEEMPPGSFYSKPVPDLRSFARVVNHVTEAQLHTCGTLNGAGPGTLPAVPSDTAEKAVVLKALEASFAECDKAYGAATDGNLAESFSVGSGHRSRIGMLWGNVSHDNEQYAILALYLRLKGMVPPSAEK